MHKHECPPEEVALAELFGAMQTFRNFGFSADNLYVLFGAVDAHGVYKGQKCVAVHLKQGDETFTYTICPVRNDKKFARRWQAFSTALQPGNVPPEAAMAITERSVAWQTRGTIAIMLETKGIAIPNRLD